MTSTAVPQHSIVPDTVSPALLRAAVAVPSPSLIYVADEVTDTVTQLRDDLAPIPGTRICYAVKANRFPPLLAHLAKLGLGADVAGHAELDAALAAGMSPIYATSPGLSASDLVTFVDRGALPDVDSVSQLRELIAAGVSDTEIGLRIRTPVSPSDGDGDSGLRWSRFGVDPADPELHELLAAGRLRVVRLHAHTGELAAPERVTSLVGVLLSCLRVFPHATTINIGGGLTLLYANRSRARQAWSAVGRMLEQYKRKHGRRLTLVVEPGMLLTAMAGYLVVSVRAAESHPDGHRLATVDASGWSLLAWAAPRIVGTHPRRKLPPLPHDIAGASCYENDYLVRAAPLPPVEVGDRLVLASAGAYVSSMARLMHGFPVPPEWILHGGEEVVGHDGTRIPVRR